MPSNQRESGSWLADLVSGLFDAGGIDLVEIVYWLIRGLVHLLILGFQALFHLLTCHF